MSIARPGQLPSLLRGHLRPTLPRSPQRLSLSTATSSHGNGAGPHPSSPPRRSFLTYTALLTTGVVSGLVLSLVVPRPRLLSILYPVPTPAPEGVDSVEGIKHARDLEKQLQNLDIVKRLRNERMAAAPADTTRAPSAGSSSLTAASGADTATSSTVAKYYESRPYAATPPGPHSLTGYSLRGPGKFALPPLVFSTADNKQSIFVIHIGAGLCGHEGITHGGLLGTLLDECLGRTALLALPNTIGVTATLELAYKKPTFANQFVVVRADLKELKGRKAWVEGHIEDLDGQVLVEGKALFVEPRMAKFLDSSSVRKALGA